MTEQEALRRFIEQIRWLHEPEFGDFKRKVGLYIQRLEEAVPSLLQGGSLKHMDEMKKDVLFAPNGQVEPTRRRVLSLAQRMLGTNSELH